MLDIYANRNHKIHYRLIGMSEWKQKWLKLFEYFDELVRGITNNAIISSTPPVMHEYRNHERGKWLGEKLPQSHIINVIYKIPIFFSIILFHDTNLLNVEAHEE